MHTSFLKTLKTVHNILPRGKNVASLVAGRPKRKLNEIVNHWANNKQTELNWTELNPNS